MKNIIYQTILSITKLAKIFKSKEKNDKNGRLKCKFHSKRVCLKIP